MNLNGILFSFTLAATTGMLSLTVAPAHAQQPTAVAIDNDDIGGVVAGPVAPRQLRVQVPLPIEEGRADAHRRPG